jgi:peptidoglycan hydrolase-like protein with peptidoglycan-binding domain
LDWTSRALTLVRNPQSLVPPSVNDPSAPPAAPADPDTLAPGASGDKVQALQRDLISLGYGEARENGVFGAGTKRALQAFQRSQGLTETGVTDPATRAALDRALGPVPDPAPGAPPAPDPGPPPRPPIDTTPAEKPLSHSRTIWGAILAGAAGAIEFIRGQFAHVAALFPVIETPYGGFNTVWILACLLAIGVILVIYARIDDRNKKKR